MSSPSKPPESTTAKRQLPLAAGSSAAPVVCSSNQYLWDDEIAAVRAMHDIKLAVRDARARGDLDEVGRLRRQFKELDEQRERIRRKRLDSLGWFNYD